MRLAGQSATGQEVDHLGEAFEMLAADTERGVSGLHGQRFEPVDAGAKAPAVGLTRVGMATGARRGLPG